MVDFSIAGFVFSPKDHEIFDYFLRMKINNVELPELYHSLVPERNLYGHEHPRNMFNPNGENNYAFTRLFLLSPKRVNRQFQGRKDWKWKPDKSEDVVVDGRVLGKKRSLTFMEGSMKSSSHWNMDEYTFCDWKNGDWAFCSVRFNGETPAAADDGQEATVNMNEIPDKKRRFEDENIMHGFGDVRELSCTQPNDTLPVLCQQQQQQQEAVKVVFEENNMDACMAGYVPQVVVHDHDTVLGSYLSDEVAPPVEEEVYYTEEEMQRHLEYILMTDTAADEDITDNRMNSASPSE